MRHVLDRVQFEKLGVGLDGVHRTEHAIGCIHGIAAGFFPQGFQIVFDVLEEFACFAHEKFEKRIGHLKQGE
jgi:hypothetical protein